MSGDPIRPGFLGAVALLHGFAASPYSIYFPGFCFAWGVLHWPLLLTWPLYGLAWLRPRFRTSAFLVPWTIGLLCWLTGFYPLVRPAG